MKKILFLVLMLIASTSYADRWKFVGSPNFSNTFWINIDSIVINGDVRDTWSAAVNIDKKLKYDLALVNEKYNCKQKLKKTETYIFYRKGNILENSAINGKWERVIPGTVGSSVFEAACNPNYQGFTSRDIDDLSVLTKEIQDVMKRVKKEHEMKIKD